MDGNVGAVVDSRTHSASAMGSRAHPRNVRVLKQCRHRLREHLSRVFEESRAALRLRPFVGVKSAKEAVMKRAIALFLGVFATVGAGRAFAQEASPGPGTVEVTIIPGGGMFFTSKNGAPSFGDYTLGGAVTYNINRIVGVEGEVSGSLGISQNLDFANTTMNAKSPNTLNYSGNAVVSVPTHGSVVPYATGGLGGLTMFERASLGIDSSETFLTGNVGGGLKWYAPNNRWGLRGDYRFTYVWSKDNAPAFFGTDDRYGHRFYGGVILNVMR